MCGRLRLGLSFACHMDRELARHLTVHMNLTPLVWWLGQPRARAHQNEHVTQITAVDASVLPSCMCSDRQSRAITYTGARAFWESRSYSCTCKPVWTRRVQQIQAGTSACQALPWKICKLQPMPASAANHSLQTNDMTLFGRGRGPVSKVQGVPFRQTAFLR